MVPSHPHLLTEEKNEAAGAVFAQDAGIQFVRIHLPTRIHPSARILPFSKDASSSGVVPPGCIRNQTEEKLRGLLTPSLSLKREDGETGQR